nr:hypothetical protein [Tanacetum cinerariifolium]
MPDVLGGQARFRQGGAADLGAQLDRRDVFERTAESTDGGAQCADDENF